MKWSSRLGNSEIKFVPPGMEVFPPAGKLLLLVLFAVLAVAAGAQTTPKLRPGSGLIEAALIPGTLAQEPVAPQAVPDSNPKVNPWESGLHIEILKGDRGVNIIKKNTAVTPVVDVKDRNNLPVAGIVVFFSSPSDGPSVTFLNGERSFSAVTDANGQASATGLKPVNTGSFQIHVSVTDKAALVATAVIVMTNYLTASDAAHGGGTGANSAHGAGLSHLTIGLIVGAAAAAGVGIALGLAGHGGGASTSSTTTVSIGVGTGGTVGPPH
jgi:hypothetical protein